MPKKTICCIVGCVNSKYSVETEGVSYFKLPSDKDRAIKWLEAMGNPPAKNKMLFCELHFAKKFIRQGPKRRRLPTHALPTLAAPDPAAAEARRWRRQGSVLVAHQTTQTSPAQPENKPPDPLKQPIVEDIFVEEETVIQPIEDIFVKEETVIQPMVEDIFVEEETVIQPMVEDIFVEEETVIQPIEDIFVKEETVIQPIVDIFVKEETVIQPMVEDIFVEEETVIQPIAEDIFVEEETVIQPIVDIFVKEETVIQPMVEDIFVEEETVIQPILDIFVKEETVIQPADTPAPVSDKPTPIKQEPDEGVQPQTPDDSELRLLVKLSQAHLSPELAKFIKVQVALKRTARVSGEETLLFGLKLFHKFQQQYRLMHDTFGLPPVAKFKQLFSASAVDELWERALARRFLDATPLTRDCVLCVARSPLRRALRYDEARDRLVGLHEIDGVQWPCTACSVVIVVARGIHARWRQPLAYCMLGAGTDIVKLRLFLDRLISKLFNMGLMVRALVTDFDDAFATTSWPVSPLQPFYNANTGEQKSRIFIFYDCSLLMVRFRDIFMKYDINFNGMIASWDDILKLYEYDKARADRLAPGLTFAHVLPAAGARSAALAVEALAPAVGDALASAVALGVLGEEARGTARLVSLMGTLYETLHSKELFSRGPGSSCQKNAPAKFLTETNLTGFDNISLIDKETRAALPDPGVIAAWHAATRAALSLLEANRAIGVAVLPMCSFNNDPLEDFFRRLRVADAGENPTGEKFLRAFEKNLVFHALNPIQSLEHETIDQFLNAACEIASVPCAAPAPERLQAPPVPNKHLEMLLPLSPALVSLRRLVAPRLLELCLAEHAGCARMDKYCHSLQLPVGFCRFLDVLEARFRAHMSGSRAAAGLLAGLLQLVALELFDQPCPCFPLLYLKSVFMRYRIRCLTHYNNHILIGNKDAEFELDYLF